MASAVTAAMEDSCIVSSILRHLSDMKYKDRRQYGPDQPVEFLEFRPTLVPSILVNRLWAEEGTSILWARYPHLPSLKMMQPQRRQYYANKIETIFSISSPPDRPESLDYLDDLHWPNLKSLELEVDLQRHGSKFASMMHPGLEHLEISGVQSGGSSHFTDVVFPVLLASCLSLKSIRFVPETLSDNPTLHASAFYDYLDSVPSIVSVEVKATNFIDKDYLFTRLSQRVGLEGLEIDLEPGINLLPQLSDPASPSPLFSSLKRLTIMCYPEVALALPNHLEAVEELQIELGRIPDRPVQTSDLTVVEDLLAELCHCPRLRLLKIGLGLIALEFPSFHSLPRLGGAALVQLSVACPLLEDVSIFSARPSALDCSDMSSEHFDMFCKNLPRLRNLSLKLHPTTATALESTALQSLGEHCKQLELVRIKLPFQLPSLPVPSAVPEILIFDESSTSPPQSINDLVPESSGNLSGSEQGKSDLGTDHSKPINLPPLFPRLVHLAISRPETVLSVANGTFTMSSASVDDTPSDVVDPEIEEELVRTWAHPLLTHFPKLEILESWGDWVGQDHESLNYFLPTEEILASTWEFLSGAEQDLWDDEGDEDGGENWQVYDGSTDWEAASYVDQFLTINEKLRPFEDEPDGTITPGRIHDHAESFQHPGKGPVDSETSVDILPVSGHDLRETASRLDELADTGIL
ncbi:hypothetical protein K504DRAFT_405454 [Pleomassaria siparia CBS 279.74]|uniref:Uncharacterized protein n=1 Tax=Pleomassaria siparia CBS 279.74 TaxID=1314801 RepID=A0A6G1KD22_9PLEO|nr:hypothetical protein K504DRAFT_405454 [Pleomassaria siparia CBS 279.74]